MKTLCLALLLLASGCIGTESTNPPGMIMCERDAECPEHCAALAAYVRGPTVNAHRFDATECEAGQCHCIVGDGFVLLAPGGADRCLVHGRDRSCLYRADEFPGCDPATATSCDASCAELEARLDADAARTLDVEVRSASCDLTSYLCQCVVRIEDGCYVDQDLTQYDCSLSDAEILASEAGEAPACPPSGACDAGTTVP